MMSSYSDFIQGIMQYFSFLTKILLKYFMLHHCQRFCICYILLMLSIMFCVSNGWILRLESMSIWRNTRCLFFSTLASHVFYRKLSGLIHVHHVSLQCWWDTWIQDRCTNTLTEYSLTVCWGYQINQISLDIPIHLQYQCILSHSPCITALRRYYLYSAGYYHFWWCLLDGLFCLSSVYSHSSKTLSYWPLWVIS